MPKKKRTPQKSSRPRERSRETHRDNPRETVVRILHAWRETELFPDRMIDAQGRHKGFVQEVVFGVVRRFRALEWMVKHLSNKAPRPLTARLLESAIYQLLFMDHVEGYAVVNEHVELARRLGSDGEARFVNALLRRVERERETLFEALAGQSAGIRWSHPDLLVERWRGQWGDEKMEALCEWNNRVARPVICLAESRDAEAYCEHARAQGMELEPHPYRPERYLIVPQGIKIPALPGYGEGAFWVQDPATSAAVDLLDPQPGERVLDLCAAPGGKTLAIAERMKGEGILFALDRHADRLVPLRENLERMKADWVQVAEGDGTSWWPGELMDHGLFDRILLDVPCSNTGVLQRRPDARYRFATSRLRHLMKLQAGLLDHAAELLAPTGTIVYSTCSLEVDENEVQIERWLSKHSEFKKTDEMRLLPPDTQTDGAYAVRVERS